MIFNVMTLFPEMVNVYINTSIIKNACDNSFIKVNVFNIRDFSEDRHKRVDDYTYGGGAGMLMTCQPIVSCYEYIKSFDNQTKLIYFSPKGKIWNNEKAKYYSKMESITLLCGHYEGIDQRIIDLIVDEEVSIGDYVLTGGELASLVLIDSISRKIDGVLSSKENVIEESFEKNLLEYPQYTRPRKFRNMNVPEVLLSGDHEKIRKWRYEKALELTKKRRPDLLIKDNKC